MGRLDQRRHSIAIDAACLCLIGLLTAAPYILRLGYYGDDWGILAAFKLEDAAGSLDPVSAAEAFGPRPVQGFILAMLFKLFGLNPLGYHIVNSAVLIGGAALFYWLLVRLQFSRVEALAAALLFIVLPQLSTVRVWVAAAQIPLSMAFMLASLHAQLSFARTPRPGWALLSLVLAGLSVATYEIFAPPILGFAIWLAVDRTRAMAAPEKRRRIAAVSAAALAAAVAMVGVKLLATDRAGSLLDVTRYAAGLRQLVRLDYDWRVDSSLNILAALHVHFWSPIAGWGQAIAQLPDPPALAAAAAAAALCFWRLRAEPVEASPGQPSRLVAFGVALFLLGHATFLIVPSIIFTPTGVGNRVLVAAALGVAMCFSALAAVMVRALPRRSRVTVFALLIAIAIALGTLRTAYVASYWAHAPNLQQQVLSSATRDLEGLPSGATVILDGVCPYHGPAIVFEAPWDVSGALTLALGREVRGDIVSVRTAIAANGLSTSIYRQEAFYAFGPRLYAYNPHLRLVRPLPDAAAAKAFFARPGQWATPCPESFVGRGVPI
jgi:hypothetical protein